MADITEDDIDIKNEFYDSVQESDVVWVKSELAYEDFYESPNSSGDTIDDDKNNINHDSFDSVYFLLNTPTAALTHEQKLNLKAKIARPKLNITQKDGKYTRSFPQSWYKKYRWLAGCKTTQTYHCYYCLMFGGEEGWTTGGQTTLKNFEPKASKHAISKLHIKNSELFHMLGRQKIDCGNSENCRVEVEKHNSAVARNRKIVSRLIDVVCYLGKQEQPLSGNVCGNKGNYLDTLNMLAMEEGLIKDHLETNTVFHGTSSEVQNSLIESITITMNEIIQNEINEVNFVSIQMDQNTDVCVKAPLSIIVRYVHSENIVERFMGFYDISNDKSAEALSKIIFALLEKHNMEKKLVSQTYDGASLCGVQTLIHQKCTDASLVHSYEHHLNLVLLQSLRNIKEVKIFIRNLAAFDSFFGISSRRVQLLQNQGFKLPNVEDKTWNYNSLAVKTIKQHYKELQRAISYVIESDEWDPESVNSALILQQILDSLTFTFFVCLFNKVLIYSEYLFQNFQFMMGSVDISLLMKEFSRARTSIKSLRSEYVVLKCVDESLELNTKVENDFQPQKFVETHQQLAFQIFDSILEQLEERFSSFENISFIELLNHNKFEIYKKSFPDAQLSKLTTHPVFNFGALRNELINIYNSEDKVIPCAELMSFIMNNELQSVYKQTMHLIRLILTIPLTPTTSSSTLQRIKSFLRNSMINTLPANIATIAIEKELAQSCCKNSAFKESVIDIFSEMKNKSLELIYKKM